MAYGLPVKQYVNQQLTEETHILRLSAFNEKGKIYPKRYLYFNLEKYINNYVTNGTEPHWIVVPGLRGVGKTTILAQLFFNFQEMFQKRILYISLDDVVHKLNSNLYEVLDAYEEILGTSFPLLREKVLLLVDEVHYDSKWQFALKSLYDKSKQIFILTTGSSAISLHITPDIARRALIEKMYPLKFTEYIMLSYALTDQSKDIAPITSISNQIKDSLLSCKNVKNAYTSIKALDNHVVAYWRTIDKFAIKKYLQYYSLPSVLLMNDSVKIYQILNSIIERIIEKDIPSHKFFSHEVLLKIRTLLFMLAGSGVISFNSLAENLGGIDLKTLSSVFDVLEKSELLIRIYPLSSSIYKKVRKPSKYLFLASSLRAALLNVVDSKSIDMQHKGKLLEDAVGMYLTREFMGKGNLTISYDSAHEGADFVLEIGSKKIIIEVGWNKKNARQIRKTMQNIGGDYGLLITNSNLNISTDSKILTIPLEYFFLL